MNFPVLSTATPPAIGHSRLDDDHNEFLELALRLRRASREGILPAFDALRAHANEHFAFEDAMMAPHDFASKECHVDEHAAVLRSFEEVRSALLAGRTEIATRFADYVIGWLPEHVDALDRHLAKFVFYRQSGGAPVLLHR